MWNSLIKTEANYFHFMSKQKWQQEIFVPADNEQIRRATV